MQDELTMDLDLRIYWQLIRHWLWLIVLAALLAGGTAYTVSKWMVEPVYNAAVRIIVQPSSSLMGSDYADIMAGQRAAAADRVADLELPGQADELVDKLFFLPTGQ